MSGSSHVVLFVDDEENVLSGFRRILMTTDNPWTAKFASSGEAALEIINSSEIDVVVSDMRMPKMDGAELLRRIRDSHPHIARIILSGQSETDAGTKSVHIAHQFLNKPCDPVKLFGVINRTISLQSELGSDLLRAQFGAIESLPTPPEGIRQLNDILVSTDAEFDDVARIIEFDPALSAKLLQIANSAFFGLAHEVTDVRQAISYLGLSMVHSLAVAVQLSETLHSASKDLKEATELLQQHSATVANIAAQLATNSADRQIAFTAGLLHDVGLLAISGLDPQKFLELVNIRNTHGHCTGCNEACPEAEKKFLGTTHASLGAYLLTLWGLPHSIVEAVAWHHSPDQLAEPTLSTTHLVHLADYLAFKQSHPEVSDASCFVSQNFLARTGLDKDVTRLLNGSKEE